MSSRKDKVSALHAQGTARLYCPGSATPLIEIILSPADIGTSNSAPISADRGEPQAANAEGHDPMGPQNRSCGVVDPSHNLDIHAVAEGGMEGHGTNDLRHPVLSLTTCLTSMTFAPRTEIFVRLVCETYMPEIALPPASMGIYQATTPVLTVNMSHIPNVLVFFDNGTQFLGNQFRVPRPTAQCHGNWSATAWRHWGP